MTYEYVCTACSHQWEAEQSISEPALKACPSCQAETAKRQISGGAGFILKGGGWYADLYGSPKPASKTEGGSAETKTETASGSKESSTPKETSGSKDTSSSKDTSTSTPAVTPAKPSAASAS